MAEGKRVVEELTTAFNAGDDARCHDLFAADFVNHNPPPFRGAGADRAGHILQMENIRTAFPDGQVTVHHLIEEGDLVVLHDTVRGTHEGPLGDVAPTGRTVELEFIHIFRVADGRFVERWGLNDLSAAMRELAGES